MPFLLLIGCGMDGGSQPSQPSQASDESAIVRRGNGGDPGSLDPALAEDVHAYNVLLDLYEGLVTAAADGAIAAGAAESWSVSTDGRTYRFNLRPDARWSNGEPLLASHFVNGFRHVAAIGTRSPNAFLLAPVVNFERVLRGEAAPEALGIRAEGERTVVIQLERPALYFLEILTMPVASPRLPRVHDDPAAFRLPRRFVGNGPYRLDEWRPGGILKLRRNDRFHGRATVAPAAVHYLPITDASAEYNQYRAGTLDITATISPAAYATLQFERPAEVRVSPGIGLYYLALDLTEPPFDSLPLRKALSMAIDREKLVRILGRGEQAAYGLVPTGVRGHVPASYEWKSSSVDERNRRARQALAAAGFGAGRALSVTLTYDAGDVHEKVALAVRSMWQEVLGVDVRLERLEWKAFLDLRNDRGAWQAMRFSWIGDFDDASTFLDLFVSGGLQNLAGYSSPDFDALMKRASASVDPAERGRMMTAAERLLIDDYAFVPLYYYVNKHLVSERVRGFLPNLLDRHPSRYLRLTEQ